MLRFRSWVHHQYPDMPTSSMTRRTVCREKKAQAVLERACVVTSRSKSALYQ